jgi:hypothetical protein
MKGLSRKNFSQAGCRAMIDAWQLATQGCRSGATIVATPNPAVAQLTKDRSTLIPGSQFTNTLEAAQR